MYLKSIFFQQTPQMTPINLYATPGRSILKSSNLTNKSAKKSIKLVLFNESDNDIDALQELDTKEPTDPIIDSVEDIDLHTDSGLFSMDIDKNTEQKENTPRLVRQDAVECHVMTRSRRKSLQAQIPEIETETESKTEESTAGKTPRRTARRKKSVHETETEKTPKRSTRKKALQEVESNVIEEVKATPKRSNRRRKSAPLLDLMT